MSFRCRFTVDVPVDATIADLKSIVMKKAGISAKHIRLMLPSKEVPLPDTATVEECGCEYNSSLVLLVDTCDERDALMRFYKQKEDELAKLPAEPVRRTPARVPQSGTRVGVGLAVPKPRWPGRC